MRLTSEIAKGTQIQLYRLLEVIQLLVREKTKVKGRENIKLVFLSAIFGHFGCFAAQLVIFFTICSRVSAVCLARFDSYGEFDYFNLFFLTILFLEKFVRDDLVLELELFSCSISQVNLYQTSLKKKKKIIYELWFRTKQILLIL